MKALAATHIPSLTNARSERLKKMWSSCFRDSLLKEALKARQGGIESLHKAITDGSTVDNLSGNLGYLAFLPDGPDAIWGLNTLGASLKARRWDSEGRKPLGQGDLPKPLPFAVKSRREDSEYLLLNAFAGHLNQQDQARGHADLVTELLPCSSCEDVLERFARTYPDVSLSIFYFVEKSSDVGRAAAMAKRFEQVNKGVELYKLLVAPASGDQPTRLSLQWGKV